MASGPSHGLSIPTHPELYFYPAYCNKASPTYFTWVKLTASDIHHSLRDRLCFVTHHHNIGCQRPQSQQAPALLFYLNHPIQFVYVVGVVVGLDDYDRYRVFTVDDSSGATIDVSHRKPEQVKEQDENSYAQLNGNVALPKAAAAEASSTKGDGTLDEANALVEVVSRVDIGSVVKVKGTINTFRSARQMTLERLEIIRDTNAEVRFWRQRTQLFVEVLSKPWELSAEEQQRLLREAEGEVEDTKGRAARRAKRAAKQQRREKRHAEKIAKAYELEERVRERVAEEMRQHGMKLKEEKISQAGKSTIPNGRVTNLRELVSSK